MIVANYIALILLLIGGINWGLVGLFRFNLIDWMFRWCPIIARIIYILVLISTIYLIVSACIDGGIMLTAAKKVA